MLCIITDLTDDCAAYSPKASSAIRYAAMAAAAGKVTLLAC
jgi:hypothetical protein